MEYIDIYLLNYCGFNTSVAISPPLPSPTLCGHAAEGILGKIIAISANTECKSAEKLKNFHPNNSAGSSRSCSQRRHNEVSGSERNLQMEKSSQVKLFNWAKIQQMRLINMYWSAALEKGSEKSGGCLQLLQNAVANCQM